MEYLDKAIAFLSNAVSHELGRYLLIIFLIGFMFVFFFFGNLLVRAIIDPILQKIFRVKEGSRIPAVIGFILALVLSYFALGLIYGWLPQLSPFTYMKL